MVNPQKRYSKERRHSPARVLGGKESAERQRSNGRWESDTTRQIRSAHLGYDCYATGKITGEAGKIRCLIKSTRLPPHITHDIQAILPVEMWWPQRDHAAAHAMIDAVLTFDLRSMASWKSLWPTHEFGYEQFMTMAERHLTQLNAKTLDHVQESNKLMAAEQRADPQHAPRIPKPSLFPCAVAFTEPAGEIDHGDCRAILAVARFEDGSAALRVTVRSPPIGERRGILLSRVYVDLITGEWEIIEHYPGRYVAMGLPPKTLFNVLGIKHRLKVAQRRSEPKPATSSGKETVEERSHRLNAVISSGNPDAQPPPVVVPEDDAPADVDVTVFPEAPGRPSLR